MISRRAVGYFAAATVVCCASYWWLHGFHSSVDAPVSPNGSDKTLSSSTVANAASAASTDSPTTPSIVTSDAAQEVTPTSSQNQIPRLSRKLEWNKEPGTLNDQIAKAFDTRNGDTAIDLAAKLQECELNNKVLAAQGSQGGDVNASPAVQAARNERLQEYQRIAASCQTVGGDQQQLRLRLLEVALEQKVPGAAAEMFMTGDRRTGVVQQVASDATNGDIQAMFQVASNRATAFSISSDTQDAIRYALKLASDDPNFGSRVRTYYEQAQILSAQIGGETSPKFDLSNISSNARTQAAEIKAKLASRVSGRK